MYNEKQDISDSFAVIKANQTKPDEMVSVSEVDVNSINFENKTIVVFCGNNTRDSRRASFYASCIYSWIKDDTVRKNTDIYSVYYPKDQPISSSFETDTRFDYDALAKALFEKAIIKNGKIQTTDQIIKNLSTVVFFGHSIGGFVMNELMFGLGKFLNERNFSDEDIKKIYEKIIFIAYSPYSLVAAPVNHIYITPLYDSLGSTKLVYDRMLKVGNMVTSNPKLDIQNICKFRSASYYNFLKLFELAMKDQDTLYFHDHNSVIATPNLLYFNDYDGIKEDHNLAGVISYPTKNPYKTKAGELTTDFLIKTFDYALSTSREKFSTAELFKKITSDSPASKNEQSQTENKELK